MAVNNRKFNTRSSILACTDLSNEQPILLWIKFELKSVSFFFKKKNN